MTTGKELLLGYIAEGINVIDGKNCVATLLKLEPEIFIQIKDKTTGRLSLVNVKNTIGSSLRVELINYLGDTKRFGRLVGELCAELTGQLVWYLDQSLDYNFLEVKVISPAVSEYCRNNVTIYYSNILKNINKED